MKTFTIDEAQKELPVLIGDGNPHSVVIVTPDGQTYRMIIEKIDGNGADAGASKSWRGKPLYTQEDRNKMKSPYPNEPSWE